MKKENVYKGLEDFGHWRAWLAIFCIIMIVCAVMVIYTFHCDDGNDDKTGEVIIRGDTSFVVKYDTIVPIGGGDIAKGAR